VTGGEWIHNYGGPEFESSIFVNCSPGGSLVKRRGGRSVVEKGGMKV